MDEEDGKAAAGREPILLKSCRLGRRTENCKPRPIRPAR